MTAKPESLCISTPGRICLFGEHQDYLGLPVVAAAISLRVRIRGTPRADSAIRISLPDIGSEIAFSIEDASRYELERDYFRSSISVLHKAGVQFTHGCDCTVQGEIPLGAGTSSSSAMVVSWIHFLLRLYGSRQPITPDMIARFAHLAEVVSFGEPGGMMDQCATALGGVLALRFYPSVNAVRLPVALKSFVLGDSFQSKDTKRILASVKDRVLRLSAHLKARYPGFSLQAVASHDLEPSFGDMADDDLRLLAGTIRNRDIAAEALTMLQAQPLDENRFGALLNEHHAILRDVLGISTPKIDRMIDAALAAGAQGGKINGSGGGGCMFAYAPRHPEVVAEAIESAGGKSYIVHVDEGTQIEARN